MNRNVLGEKSEFFADLNATLLYKAVNEGLILIIRMLVKNFDQCGLLLKICLLFFEGFPDHNFLTEKLNERLSVIPVTSLANWLQDIQTVDGRDWYKLGV